MTTLSFMGYSAAITEKDGIFTIFAPEISEAGTTCTAKSMAEAYELFQEIVIDWMRYTGDYDNRKVKMCFIPLYDIVNLFTGKKKLVLPEGVEALDVHYDFMRDAFGLKIQHKDFVPTKPNTEMEIYPYEVQ